MSSKEKTSWGSIKTNFARTKHKVLASFGAAETTVDSKIVAEKEKLFTLFKLMKRLNKNVDKYEATLKEINILQNEISHDLLALHESDPAIKAYQEVSTTLEQERIRIEEILENYYHDPLRVYLSQFRDIRSRLEELDLRRLDMDRYYRDYNIKANKGKDAQSLQKTENKHTKTKEAYQELSDEIMKDMYALFDDRKEVFDPAFACFINRNNEYFARAAADYQQALPIVANINEYDAVTHPQAITPVESSSMSRNVRSSTVFTSPKDYSSNGSGSAGNTPTTRARASTIAAPSSFSSPPPQYQPTQPTTYDQPTSYDTNSGGVNLSKPNYRASTSYTPQQTQLPQPPQQQYYSPPPQQQDEVPFYSPPPQQQPPQQHQPQVNLYKNNNNTPPQPNLYKPPQQPIPPTFKNSSSPPHSPVYNNNHLQPSHTTTTTTSPQGSGRPLPSPTNQGAPAAFNKPRATTMASGRPLPAPVPGARKAEALYDFEGQDSTELTFRKGDIITIFKQNGEWFNAELNGVKGLVPENHLRIL